MTRAKIRDDKGVSLQQANMFHVSHPYIVWLRSPQQGCQLPARSALNPRDVRSALGAAANRQGFAAWAAAGVSFPHLSVQT